MIKDKILYYIRSLIGTYPIQNINTRIGILEDTIRNIMIENYLEKNLFNNVKYSDQKSLSRFFKNNYSQNGEDGIIREIFNRISITNRYFVEFGAHDVKNNSTYLLLQKWKGLFIEGNTKSTNNLKKKFHQFIKGGELNTYNDFVTPENIELIFKKNNVPAVFDFLSIDIDGNDYWVWKAISNYKPRVVVVEYNAVFDPSDTIIMKYKSNYSWQGDSYFGASLKALELLGAEKGYNLVGCDFSGSNAFFVLKELTNGKFQEPFTSENHYEPPRYFTQKYHGHPPGFGEFEIFE